jgi:hypothetical protein
MCAVEDELKKVREETKTEEGQKRVSSFLCAMCGWVADITSEGENILYCISDGTEKVIFETVLNPNDVFAPGNMGTRIGTFEIGWPNLYDSNNMDLAWRVLMFANFGIKVFSTEAFKRVNDLIRWLFWEYRDPAAIQKAWMDAMYAVALVYEYIPRLEFAPVAAIVEV